MRCPTISFLREIRQRPTSLDAKSPLRVSKPCSSRRAKACSRQLRGNTAKRTSTQRRQQVWFQPHLIREENNDEGIPDCSGRGPFMGAISSNAAASHMTPSPFMVQITFGIEIGSRKRKRDF